MLAHEFSHVEVATRIGGKHVPAWFDEGLATYIAGEPICTNVTGKGIDDLRKLDLETDWVAYTGPEDVFFKTYCQARAEVAAWIGKRGNTGVVQLLDAVRQAVVCGAIRCDADPVIGQQPLRSKWCGTCRELVWAPIVSYSNKATVSDFTVASSTWMKWRYSIRRSPRK